MPSTICGCHGAEQAREAVKNQMGIISDGDNLEAKAKGVIHALSVVEMHTINLGS